jgi:hypothetical protein
MLVFSLLMPLSIIVRLKHNLYSSLLVDLPFFVTATFSVCFFYVATQREIGISAWQRVKYLPFLLSLGIGLAINNAKAVIEALLNQESGFTRTPKTGSEGKNAQVVKKSYRGKKSWLPALELAFGVYFTFALWLAWHLEVYTSLPFLVLFQMGFLYVGLSSLLQGRRAEPGLS